MYLAHALTGSVTVTSPRARTVNDHSTVPSVPLDPYGSVDSKTTRCVDCRLMIVLAPAALGLVRVGP